MGQQAWAILYDSDRIADERWALVGRKSRQLCGIGH
jgi:hypothetical protein